MRGSWQARSALGAVAAAAAFAYPALAAAPISWVPDRTYVTSGPVDPTVRIGDKLYIGGSFRRIGPRTGPWSVVDAATGAVKPGLPELAGGKRGVLATVSDGAGGWYVGGDFTHVA